MEKIAILVSDELFYNKIKHEILCYSLQESVNLVIENFLDIKEIMNNIANGSKYDIIYCDLNALQMNCLETIKFYKKHELDKNSKIIFISKEKQLNTKLFKLMNFEYLSYSSEDNIFNKNLKLSLDRYFRVNVINNKTLLIKFRKKLYRVPFKDILYIENNLRKIIVHSKRAVYSFYSDIATMAKVLGESFERIHESYLINSEYKKEIIKSTFILEDGTKLPISRPYLIDVRKNFKGV